MTNRKICRCLVVVVAAVLGLCSCCRADVERGKRPEASRITSRYTLYENIRYGVRSHRVPPTDPASDRLLDIYIPRGEQPAEGWPIVVYIHGGGFCGGAKVDTWGIHPMLPALTERGYAVVAINYYLRGKYHPIEGYPIEQEMGHGLPKDGKFHPERRKYLEAASADAVRALRWMVRNGEAYGLNLDKVALCGGSAGAMTALHTAYVRNPEWIDVDVVLNMWGGLEDVSVIEADMPALFTLHGEVDNVISVEYGKALHRRAEEVGLPAVLHIMEGKGHAQGAYATQTYLDEFLEFFEEQTQNI